MCDSSLTSRVPPLRPQGTCIGREGFAVRCAWGFWRLDFNFGATVLRRDIPKCPNTPNSAVFRLDVEERRRRAMLGTRYGPPPPLSVNRPTDFHTPVQAWQAVANAAGAGETRNVESRRSRSPRATTEPPRATDYHLEIPTFG